jgi:hypothetical protein
MKKFNTAYSRARFSRFRVLQNRDRESVCENQAGFDPKKLEKRI